MLNLSFIFVYVNQFGHAPLITTSNVYNELTLKNHIPYYNFLNFNPLFLKKMIVDNACIYCILMWTTKFFFLYSSSSFMFFIIFNIIFINFHKKNLKKNLKIHQQQPSSSHHYIMSPCGTFSIFVVSFYYVTPLKFLSKC